MKAISLFSGCGGCSLGLKQAGFDVVLAVDIDKNACESYSTNLGYDKIWHADLSVIEPEALLKRSRCDQSGADIIVGGPPCQGFSSAGTRDWADPRNALLRKFIEIVTALK